jgi:DNA-binding NtrC family response regulator
VLLGSVLEGNRRSQSARDQLRVAQALCLDAGRTPPLEDLLSPPSMQAIRREIESAIPGDAPILILGESGTGKTLMAQAIAEASGRRPIVRAVLGASDDLNTITSELFGHERGSFSGATGKRMGLAEFANGGTLILDEILNLPPNAQQLLLDFTQFGTYRPLGYDRAEPKRAKVRLIAATNGDLQAAIREKRMRQDLYFRLAALTIELPPLRQRREDIPTMAESTLRRVDPSRTWSLSVALRRLLVSPALDWSGNVRQLERAIERARERAVARDPEATMLTPWITRRSRLRRVPGLPRPSLSARYGRSSRRSAPSSTNASRASFATRSRNPGAWSPRRHANSGSRGRRSRAASKCWGSVRRGANRPDDEPSSVTTKHRHVDASHR